MLENANVISVLRIDASNFGVRQEGQGQERHLVQNFSSDRVVVLYLSQ